MQMPRYQGGYYPIPRNEMFLVYFTAGSEKNGAPDLYVIPARFVERIERNRDIYAKLEPLGEAERSQRREGIRLPLSISVSLRRIRDGEADACKADARMINFSGGGMLIATDERLDTDESVILDFSLDGCETVRGVVRRAEASENAGCADCAFVAAIEFDSADSAQRERFYRFIMVRLPKQAS